MGSTIVTPLLKDQSIGAYKVIFYLFVALVALTLGSLLVGVYQIATRGNSKKQIQGFNASFLKVMSELYISVLFLPSLQIFLYMFSCGKDASGRQMHLYLKDEACYEGASMGYYIVGSAMSLALTAFTYMATVLMYECRLNSRDLALKLNSKWDVQLLLYKVVLVVSGVIFGKKSQAVILISVIFLMGYQVFDYYVHNQIFINQRMNKIMLIFNGCNLWVAICLILAQITEKQDFSDSAQVYFLGVPLIILICSLKTETNYVLLIDGVNNFINESQAYNSVSYLIKLLLEYQENDQSRYIMEGYLDTHRILCTNPECPSKLRVMKNNQFVKGMRQEKMSESYITLIWTVKNLF